MGVVILGVGVLGLEMVPGGVRLVAPLVARRPARGETGAVVLGPV